MGLQSGGQPVIYTCYGLFCEFTQLSQEKCKVAHMKVNSTGTNKCPCAQHESMRGWGKGQSIEYRHVIELSGHFN
jgi:hypothetical protein